jgi:predicted ATPase/DNA-binding CsgD family transcriptional regulator
MRTGNQTTDETSLVGRRRELSEAKRLLMTGRPLTLTGPAGVGKSRLARRIAADMRRTFTDGTWLADFAAVSDPTLLAHVAAGALGLADQSGRPTFDTLVKFLHDRHLLLVLDGWDLDPQSCGALVDELLDAAPGLCLLVTSRRPLGFPRERVLRVPALSFPHSDQPSLRQLPRYEAVRLFTERAAAVLPGFRIEEDNGTVLALLCRRLQGIPLAIELVAAQLRTLSPEQVLGGLDHYRSFLAPSLPAVTAQPGLDSALGWSYSALCTPEEKLLWARLSVFVGGFDLQAAQSVCSGEGPAAGPDGAGRDPVIDGLRDLADSDEPRVCPQAVFDLVASLVDRCVLIREGRGVRARYRMPEPIRMFGRERLAASGGDRTFRTRHRDYYRQLAERAAQEWFSPRQVEWLGRFHREIANLRAALEFSLSEPGQAREGLALASALSNFWASGLLGEGRRWLDRALALDHEPTPERARALWVTAGQALALRDVSGALGRLAEARDLARRLDDNSALAYTIGYFGVVAVLQDQYPCALLLFNEALERHRATGDLNGVTMTLNQMMPVAAILEDPHAQAIGEESLFLCEAYGAQWSRSAVLLNMALAKWRQGGSAQTGALVRKALRLKRLFQDPGGTGLGLELLAWTAAAHHEEERAARLLGAAHAARVRSGDPLALFGPDLAFNPECMRLARRALSGRRFEELYIEGAALGLEQAVAYALGEKPEPRPGTAGGATLTSREQQVADLLGEGLSIGEVASCLGVTPRTVESHVDRITAKLELGSRSEIGQWGCAPGVDQGGAGPVTGARRLTETSVSSSPPVTSTSTPPQWPQVVWGSVERPVWPQSRQVHRTGVTSRSTTAPAATVPSATRSNDSWRASGTIRCAAPARTRTRRTCRPPARRNTAAARSAQIPSSCMTGSPRLDRALFPGLSDQGQDQTRCSPDAVLHLRGQADTRAQARRLAAHDEDPAHLPAQPGDQRQHRVGCHSVGVDHRYGLRCPGRPGSGLDQVQGAGGLPPLGGVHDDHQVVTVEHLVGQMQPGHPVVTQLHTVGQLCARQFLGHRHAETVVAVEDVAHSGDQDPPHVPTSSGSTSSGAKYRKRPCAC